MGHNVGHFRGCPRFEGAKLASLTVKQLEALRGENHGERLRDGDGLYGVVRVNASRVSVLFRWRYRFGGKYKDFNAGTWPDTTLAEVRQACLRARGLVSEGLDPMTERQIERLKVKADQADEITKQATRLAEIEAQSLRMTVSDLFTRWERLDLVKRKDKGAEVRRAFQKDILPTLGAVAAEDVKRAMIAAALDTVVDRGAPVIARNLLGDLRQMFGFAIKRGFLENDPTSHLKRDDFGKKVERDRVLSDAEIKLLNKKLPESDLCQASIAACWIMFSTCCRVGELTQARWEHVDLDAGVWWLPAGTTKNAKEHTVHLSEFARRHFQTLLKLVEDAAHDEHGKRIAENSPWVLPASRKDGHVCLKSLSKQIGDRQRGELAPMAKRCKLTSALELPRGRWTPHDLRRTGATLMGTLGVRPDVIEKCLNHVEQNRLIRIYQRQTLKEEQAAAWRLLGERLELLTRGDADNVVPLNGACDRVKNRAKKGRAA